MRATRDLIRRRLHLVRKRGQLLAHVQDTRAQYNLPAFERRLGYPDNREGVREHFTEPSVRKSIEVDRTWVAQYDTLITDLELTIVREAKRHDADAFHRLRSVPGIGKVLAWTILYELHDITRFDRVQEFASYARLVKGQKQSAGKTLGTSGAKMGNVHLKCVRILAVERKRQHDAAKASCEICKMLPSDGLEMLGDRRDDRGREDGRPILWSLPRRTPICRRLRSMSLTRSFQAFLQPQSRAVQESDDNPHASVERLQMRTTSSRLNTTGTRTGIRARGTCSIAPISTCSTSRYRNNTVLSAWFCVEALRPRFDASHVRNDVICGAPISDG